ncbi:MAG: DJ-1/PfpI family protein [Candidatus Aenigmarchaeota archaeon]|nr:DJ-1/PfpI family protein [Candidatus Aenigmarchaeota archaeon]MBU5688829.1 DJ-1/PfpI family protein [Candidatus Aenigmarchaeota archaeon]
MPSALIIISQTNFNENEFFTTKRILSEKIKVETASISLEECIGMKGHKVKPDKTVEDALKKEYDAIAIIGGTGCYKLSEYPEVIEIIKKQTEKNKIVAAICLAPTILARAGVLKDVIATVYPSDWAIALLEKEGAHYIAKNLIEDGNIITADSPRVAEEFAKTILKKLKL